MSKMTKITAISIIAALVFISLPNNSQAAPNVVQKFGSIFCLNGKYYIQKSTARPVRTPTALSNPMIGLKTEVRNACPIAT